MTATQRPTVLLIGGTGRSGSTLLHRLLGELPGFVAVGELRYIWSEALGENRYCGCGARFLDCPFWSKVGSRAFGGPDRIDPNQVMAQERSVSRHRHIPLLAMGGATPGRYARRLDGYLGSLAPMYDAIREVSGADVIVDSTKDAAYAHVLRRMRGADFRVVHLVRDSRGVAWSWAKVVQSDPEHYMRRFSPPVTALRWVGYNLMVESLGRSDSRGCCCGMRTWCAARRQPSPRSRRSPDGRSLPGRWPFWMNRAHRSAPTTQWPGTPCG